MAQVHTFIIRNFTTFTAGGGGVGQGNLFWNDLIQLLLLTFFATVGTIGNVFTISAVLIEDHLRKPGKVEIKYRVFFSSLPLKSLITRQFSTFSQSENCYRKPMQWDVLFDGSCGLNTNTKAGVIKFISQTCYFHHISLFDSHFWIRKKSVMLNSIEVLCK